MVPMLRTEEGYRTHRGNRRKYYGQAGRYRLKPYGVEWRTPSNSAWHSYMEGQAANLFGTVNCILPLVKQGVTVEDVVGRSIMESGKRLIDGEGLGHRKRINMMMTKVIDRIDGHAATNKMFQEEIENGTYPTIYSS
jgi:hypothetical protein